MEDLAPEDVTELRERVHYEDQLLNSRTNIVLTLNGLMAIAASFSLPTGAKLVLAIVIIVVDALWIVCSLDAKHYIKLLTVRINESGKAPISERIREEDKQDRFRIGSTRFMTLVIPSLLLTGWVLGLLLTGVLS